MSANNFPACVAFTIEHEGTVFEDDPNDPGGATKFGITLDTLTEWRGHATKEDVVDLERAEAETIYRVKWWNAMLCDSLPAGLDLMLFDFGVNIGVKRAAAMLQTVLQVEADGHIGPLTVLAAKGCDVHEAIEALRQQQDEFYQTRPGYPRYGRGWDRRTLDRRNAAVEMASNG